MTSGKVDSLAHERHSPVPSSTSPTAPASTGDYRSLLAQLSEPVAIVNQAGRICFMNPAGQRCLAKGLTAQVENYLKSQRGKRPVSTASFPLDGEGRVTLEISRREIQWAGKPAVLLTLHDVSRYVKNAQRARKAHLRRLSLLDDVPLATYVMSLGDRSVTPFFSAQFEKLLGYPPQDWQDHPELWRQFIHNEDYQKVAEELAQAIRSQRPFTIEYRLKVKDGRTIWVREVARVHKDDPSGGCVVSGHLTDITQEKSRGRLLDALKRRLSEMERKHAKELQESQRELRRELSEAKDALSKLKAERTLLNQQLNERSAELVRIQNQLAAEIASRERAVKENKDLRVKLHTARDSVESLSATKERLEEELSERAGEALRLTDHLRKEIARRKQVEQRRAELEHELGAARRNAERMEAERNRLEEKLSQRSAEIERATSRAKQHAEELKQERERARQLQAQLDAAKKDLQQLTASRQQLEKQAAQKSVELEATASKLKQEQDHRRRAEEELRTLRQKLASAQQEARRLAECRRRFEQWADDRAAEMNAASTQLKEIIQTLGQRTPDPGRGEGTVSLPL